MLLARVLLMVVYVGAFGFIAYEYGKIEEAEDQINRTKEMLDAVQAELDSCGIVVDK